MTIKPFPLFQTLVFAGLALQPVIAGAQGARTTPTAPAPAPRAVTSAPAPPPAPRPATAAPSTTTTATPAIAAPAAPAAAAGGSAARGWYEQDYRLGPGDKLRIEV